MKSIDKTKRIVTLTDNSQCFFNETLQIINGETINVEDMAATKDINEVDLLFNLKNRLNLDKTFTNVGPTLIIVNPFKDIKGEYGPEKIEHFLEKHEKENPVLREKITEPHLYDVVLLAIEEILKKKCRNQALIVSGESGAGKTVATKNSMQCITYYFSKLKKKKESRESVIYTGKLENMVIKEQNPLEKKILDCNPILEGFGNAKTVRNDNSSRFGKYVKIKINRNTNLIEGAQMYTYLLEKSRITELGPLERNYHIFYFFLRGADDKLLKECFLTRNIKDYDYLWHDKSQNQVESIPSMDDVELYKEVIDCFQSTNFTEEEITDIFKVISAVLLIGNIKFKVEKNVCNLINKTVYENVCKLLNIESEPLYDAITRKYMPSEKKYGGAFDENTIKTFFDSLAKELYNRLFLWIVNKLNKTLDVIGADDNFKYIGLLDIFGFECFQRENNSIEQLCINYTNEQLQQLYIKDIFESDKMEFKREGLEDKLYLLDASYKDNKDLIRLIKLFFLKISDVTMEDNKIYDLVKNFEKFIKTDKAFKKVKENKFFVEKFTSPFFSVEHSAKTVEYNSKNMIDKNKDEMKVRVSECILKSKSKTIQYIFTNTLNDEEFNIEKNKILDESRVVAKNEKFLGLKFCKEMKQLKKELKACDHHYVRCLKPNEEKKPNLFFSNFVFNQIQYLGILATIQVRKNGFPMRRTYEDFYENYKLVLSKFIDKSKADFKAICKEIIVYLIGEKESKVLKEEYLFGNTKIYMKQIFNQKLELIKLELMKKKIYAVNIIKVAIVNLKKKQKFKKVSDSINNIQNYLKINKYRIKIKNQKDKIKRIQSMYHTYKASKEIYTKNKNYFVIQNSLRMINSMKYLGQKRQLMSFLSINLQIFSFKIKKMHIRKMKKLVSEIVEKAKEQYAYNEYNKLWNNVNPYIYRFLVIKKNKAKKNEARKIVMKNNYIACFKIFELNLLLNKVKRKKEKTKFISNFAITKMISGYYFTMIKNIVTIQKYLHIFINKEKVLDKINLDYIKNTTEINEDTENININKDKSPISPSYKNTIENNNYSLYNRTIESEIEKTIESNIYLKTLESNKKSMNETRNRKNKNANKYINNFDNSKTLEKSYISYNNTFLTNYLERNEKNKNIDKYNNNANVKGKEMLPVFYNFNQPIIRVFAKILEIDYIYKNEDIDENLWKEEFNKIYNDCIKNETPIQKIEISNTHTLVLNNIGKVFSWGWNNFGQCGTFPSLTKQSYLFPNLYNNQNNFNEIPSLPNLCYKTQEKSLPIQNVGDISIAEDFSMIITKKGNGILFGDNTYGQLGKGHRINVKSAQILQKFKNKIKAIKSSENMNLLLTKNNDLYIWNICSNDILIQPSMIYFPKKIKIDSISTGKNFSILLSSNGICYGIGSNDFGELGLENNSFREIPEEIITLSKYNERIIQVRCGFKHVVCASRNGRVYSWGNNSFGQLGHINTGNNFPNYVNIEDKGERIKIIQVSAGFRSSFFFSNKGVIYYTGVLNEQGKSFVPTIYSMNDKNYTISDVTKFLPVKIWGTYARNKSIFYATFADIRSLQNKFINKERIKDIVFTLAEKWVSDDITAPFIPHISKYFESNFMKI